MTARSTSLAFLLALSFSLPAQTAEKTFSKSFATESKGTIKLDLPGSIDLKIWDNPTIRVSITVSIPSGNSAMLRELASVGRYNLVSKAEGDVLTILAPNMQKQVKVKGDDLHETLSFVVFVPKDLKIELPNVDSYASKR
jgi:hypothetical protein